MMMVRQNIVFLTGAGVSAESGLYTFRDGNGVWARMDPQNFCTASALYEDPGRVLSFYDGRRKDLLEAAPNEAHRIIAGLEEYHDVTVITQNVDDLHERAGSGRVVHLHGELTKVTSSKSRHNLECIKEYPLWKPVRPGDLAEDGSQLRPDVVFLDEFPNNVDEAERLSRDADVFVVVGTSLTVGIASELVNLPRRDVPRYIIDPDDFTGRIPEGFIHFRMNAVAGMRLFAREAVLGLPMFHESNGGQSDFSEKKNNGAILV